MELAEVPSGIRDEDVATSAPLVRALVVARLEMMWRGVEPMVDPGQGKPDPRFVEAGIRILDRLGRLYRLDDPVPASNQGPDADRPPVWVSVAQQVAELESRAFLG